MSRRYALFAFVVMAGTSVAYSQVSGSGTKYIVPVWTGKTTLGNSSIVSANGNVGIGTGSRAPASKLEVSGNDGVNAAILGSNVRFQRHRR